MKKRRKIIFIVCSAIIFVFVIIWGISILKCEILTYLYGNEFYGLEKQNSMIGDVVTMKILDYSDNYARIYYKDKNSTYYGNKYYDYSTSNILIFIKINGQWKYEKWERTVWSGQGSADGFFWPYIR
jgi:hypothetical protein